MAVAGEERESQLVTKEAAPSMIFLKIFILVFDIESQLTQVLKEECYQKLIASTSLAGIGKYRSPLSSFNGQGVFELYNRGYWRDLKSVVALERLFLFRCHGEDHTLTPAFLLLDFEGHLLGRNSGRAGGRGWNERAGADRRRRPVWSGRL